MKQNIVKIKLYGELGKAVGEEYNLAVKTFAEAINAIQILSNGKLFKHMMENDKKGIRYKILLNGRDFIYDKNNPPRPDNLESLMNCELAWKTKDLKTIDIVPSMEGSDIISLIIYLIVSIIIAVIAAVIINALTKPPELQEFKQRQKTSFLFSGQENTINEGGPVPLGYGRLIVGSSVISAAYSVGYFHATDNARIVQQ